MILVLLSGMLIGSLATERVERALVGPGEAPAAPMVRTCPEIPDCVLTCPELTEVTVEWLTQCSVITAIGIAERMPKTRDS